MSNLAAPLMLSTVPKGSAAPRLRTTGLTQSDMHRAREQSKGFKVFCRLMTLLIYVTQPKKYNSGNPRFPLSTCLFFEFFYWLSAVAFFDVHPVSASWLSGLPTFFRCFSYESGLGATGIDPGMIFTSFPSSTGWIRTHDLSIVSRVC